ncbi:HNH endonuclease family protein [Sinorhizobium prairiense]|uniref:hypothetical protein n=1 Tax=unclassified Sinorhizobium TaxID=2613772 RepID=UPI0023D81DAD|nr:MULTISPECIES: hypothetical protein [unclassified Sinorhizobium]WEJ14050.1 hypothetical protein N0Q91_00940 [Sinorhizobium sp. K101]WEJ35651.1 hypothetical protein N0R80_00940 [Sinorhizobium sp. C101]
MIPVARPAYAPPRLDLTNPESPASLELAGIIAGLGGDGSPAVGTKFNAYSHKSVRDALQDMFHNKCAYCESQIAGSQDTDIEHYRPKGAVTEAAGHGVTHHGYWWLAMNWTNLVLSCMHCNQRRRQLILEAGMTEEQVRALIEADRTVSVGKLDSFPTEDSVWVTSHNCDVTMEKPLLIDPTRVDPDLHLEWVLNEEFSTVRARNSSPAGDASIRIYGLNRRRLTEDRMKKLLLLRISGNKALAVLNRAATAPDDAVAAVLQESAFDHLEVLRNHCADDQPFAGLARAYVRELESQIAAMRGP